MAANNNTPTKRKIVAMTPYEVFKLQVAGVYTAFRRTQYNYLPPNLGGISGQRKVIEAETVLTIVELGND